MKMEILFLSKLILFFVVIRASRTAKVKQKLSDVAKIMSLNCSLETELPDLRDTIETRFADGNLIIRFTISIDNMDMFKDNTYIQGTIYRPEEWLLIKERKGKHILMLSEDFIARALGTLSFSVSDLQLPLIQSPSKCFDRLNINQIKNVIRLDFLSNFSKESSAIPENYEICNRQINDKLVKYKCCSVHYDSMNAGQIKCEVLVKSEWINYFDIFHQAIAIVAILFCPLLIPLSMFRDEESVSYLCFFSDDEIPVKIKAEYKSISDQRPKQKLLVSLSSQPGTEDFTVGSMYEFIVEDCTIKTRHKKLIPEGPSQFGFCRTLWNTFVQMSCLNKYNGNIEKCRKFYTRSIILCLILIPHLIIIAFYIFYDKPVIDYDKRFSAAHKIELPTSPEISHPYIIDPKIEIAIDLYVFIGYCLLEYTESEVLTISHACIKNAKFSVVREMKKYKDRIANNESTKNIVVFVILCIIDTIILILRTIPLAKLVLEFPYRIIKFCKKKAEMERKKRVKLIILVVAWLPCSVFFFVHYVMICTFYYISFIVYALIGFLMNYDRIFKYVCLILLIVVYGVTCFNTINTKYCTFFKILEQNIQERLRGRMEIIAKLSESKHKENKGFKNVAFALPRKTRVEDEKYKKILKHLLTNDDYRNDAIMNIADVSEQRSMTVNIPVLILFITSNNDHVVPSIPAEFFNEMTTFRHSICPGSLLSLYFKATKDFFIVVIFLVFVILIIFVIGEANSLTSGAQTLVGLGSGFLPFLLKNFIFRSQSAELKGNKDLIWEALLDYKIDLFHAKWLTDQMTISYENKSKDNNKEDIVFFKEKNEYTFYFDKQKSKQGSQVEIKKSQEDINDTDETNLNGFRINSARPEKAGSSTTRVDCWRSAIHFLTKLFVRREAKHGDLATLKDTI